MNLPQSVPGGMARIRSAVPLLNQRPVPAGIHHDVQHSIPVVVTLHWATGIELLPTVALEWTATLVRVRIADLRVMTGAVWLPAPDVLRAASAASADRDPESHLAHHGDAGRPNGRRSGRRSHAASGPANGPARTPLLAAGPHSFLALTRPWHARESGLAPRPSRRAGVGGQ